MAYSPTLQTELETLDSAFAQRSAWWDRVADHAGTIAELHRTELNKRARVLHNIETAAHGFNRAQILLDRHAGESGAALTQRYDAHDAARAAAADPLRNVQLKSPFSRARSGRFKFYGEGFWQKYEAHLLNGDHERGRRMLLRADGKVRRAMIFLRGGTKAVAGWRADIEAAGSQLDAHRAAHARMKTAAGHVKAGEQAMAKTIRKILGDKQVREALRNPATVQAAAKRPGLALLVQYAHDDKRPTAKAIMADLGEQRGTFRFDDVKKTLATLEGKAVMQVAPARGARDEAQQRASAANGFEKSCRTAQRLETRFSAVVRNISANLTGKLSKLAADQGGTEAAAAKVVAGARVKQGRWVDDATVIANLQTLSDPAFQIADLKIFPGQMYLINAAQGSLQRAVPVAKQALSDSFAAVVQRPAQKIYTGLRRWFHGNGTATTPPNAGVAPAVTTAPTPPAP